MAYTWTEQTNSGIRDWQAVTSSSDGTKLAACVFNGYIYTSTNSGAKWEPRAFLYGWSSVASSSDGTKLVSGLITQVCS